MNRWTWNTANPAERAMWIREHLNKLSEASVRDLFQLTDDGLKAIKNGAAWRADYERPAVNNLQT